MPDLTSLVQTGTGSLWLMLPTAVLLGSLHALEPGHSKSMMMAFIVSIQGTARQAALLGLSATVGHTIVVWVLALLAWQLGDSEFLERAEPWLLIVGGLLIVALAIRILLRLTLFSDEVLEHHRGSHDHPHDNPRDHVGHDHDHARDNHDHDGDAHAAAHAAEVRQRFSGRAVTDGEILWFGFSGGLLPCPAAFAVLLVCLHQNAYGLGLLMVAAFSIGLALTLVSIGAAAAWGTGALQKRLGGLQAVARWAPFVSALIVLAIGLTVMVQGARALHVLSG
jgi:nickel/cobalt exporter